MAKQYYVVGGEHADTTFTAIAPGAKEERFGPFSEKEAHECWRALTGKTVDNAMVRYFVRPDDSVAEEEWYVVGGEYETTEFKTIAKLETYGPFDRKEAMNKWRELTGKTVDSALTRYELATAEEVEARRR